ncbi:hypothetical protein QYF36_008715 [Acer negundo]|nr:hypothetical protein QYF36_008715 [Acer negundo]
MVVGCPVLGYLAAGILISAYVYWTKVIAEFGVVFLLFNIGLKVLVTGSVGWLGCSLCFWAAQSCCNCYRAWHSRSLLLSKQLLLRSQQAQPQQAQPQQAAAQQQQNSGSDEGRSVT